MNPGVLRHVIEIQAPSSVRLPTGAAPESWDEDNAVSVRAGVSPLSGRELLAAQTAQAETSHKITLRYLPWLTVFHRIKFADRYFLIESIRNIDERNREMELRCIERG